MTLGKASRQMTAAEYRASQKPKTVNKFRAKRTFAHGLWFHSKGESERYGDLLLRQRAKRISNLDRQRPFALTVNGILIGTYTADFVYNDQAGVRVIEDFKGSYRDDLYQFRKKLFEALWPFKILETGASKSPRPPKREAAE